MGNCETEDVDACGLNSCAGGEEGLLTSDIAKGVVCGGVRGAVVRNEEVLGTGKLGAANQSTFMQRMTANGRLTIHESVVGIELL